MITRLIAIVPAVIVTAVAGERGTGQLLILSQVILSMQLSFAVVPLVIFTSDKPRMGTFVNPRWLKILAWLIAGIIGGLNLWLLIETFRKWL
jgi:manganese transport protein